MTGRDLLEAMCYVDEKYVDEAENTIIPRFSRGNIRRFGTLAACLGLILGGVAIWIGLPGMDDFKASSSECADNSCGFAPEIGEDQAVENPESAQISLILRVDAATEEGFTATVAQSHDEDTFPIGMELQVVMESDIRESADSVTYDCKSDLPEGTLVQVQPVDFSADTGTIIVNDLKILEEILPEE